jgi:prepilin-type N-terminal cleavage/methylation domain-containing protein
MKRITQTNRTGLTLIEMMVALSVGCVFFLATSFIIVAGQRSWDRTLQQATVQRDVSFAMLTMKRSIVAATKTELDTDDLGIKVYRSTGWIRYWFEPEKKNLRYQVEGQDEQMLIIGSVQNATFDVSGKSVTVSIELKQNSCEAHLLTTTTMRNYKPET